MLKGQALGDALVMHGDKTERLDEGEKWWVITSLYSRAQLSVFALGDTSMDKCYCPLSR